MNSKTARAVNRQIVEELFSAYIYQSMSAYASFAGLEGFANWFAVQAREEEDHARGFYNYLLDRAVRIELLEIPKPPSDFEDASVLFSEVLKHEKYITGKIRSLYEMAQADKDYGLMSFLQWYIDEQAEEESTAAKMLDKVRLTGVKGAGLYLLDKELKERRYKQAEILIRRRPSTG